MLNRRAFLGTAATWASTALLAPTMLAADAAVKVKRTATDQVTLGKTGIKLSRLGIGVGSNSGQVQRDLGHEGFNRLIKYAYDHGITYIDTADNYGTHVWVREAIKDLPREKFYIQSKMPGNVKDPMAALDRYRKEIGTDYIDSLLVHCATTHNWDEQQKRIMDYMSEAQQKGWIRAKGVSCHGLPALTRATQVDWVDVHLVRVNPQGRHIDGESDQWNVSGNEQTLSTVLKEIGTMHAKGRGIIGMKIIGNGEFTKPEDREKSIRFAMAQKDLDAIVIGMKSEQEIDENISRMNQALAEA